MEILLLMLTHTNSLLKQILNLTLKSNSSYVDYDKEIEHFLIEFSKEHHLYCYYLHQNWSFKQIRLNY